MIRAGVFFAAIFLLQSTSRSAQPDPLNRDLLREARSGAKDRRDVPSVPVTPLGWIDGEYAAAHAAPLDWKQVARTGTRVVYLGHTHTSLKIEDELIARMVELREAGITHLGLEDWGDDYQPLLSRYASGRAQDSDLEKALRDLQKKSQALFVTDFSIDTYVRLLHAARDAKLGLLALDIPYDDEEEIQRICDAKPQLPQCRLYDPDNDDIVDRDIRMASNLSRALGDDPKARVLAIVGAHHASLEHQPAILRGYGWASTSYLISDGRDLCASAVREIKRQDEQVFIPTPGEAHSILIVAQATGPLHFDGCIALNVGAAGHSPR